jgi:hypothetical protein
MLTSTLDPLPPPTAYLPTPLSIPQSDHPPVSPKGERVRKEEEREERVKRERGEKGA